MAAAPKRKQERTDSFSGKKRRKPYSTLRTSSTSGLRSVSDIDSLPWRLDDDGFGGLEVLEGVQVVRRGEEVQFLVPTDAGTTPLAPEVAQPDQPGNDTFDADEEEFCGFDDPVSTERPDHAPNTSCKGKPSQKPGDRLESERTEVRDGSKPKNKKKKRQDQVPVSMPPHSTQHNEFKALESVQEENSRTVDTTAWMPLSLSAAVTLAVAKLGFAKPTPIQLAAIPDILAGRDVVGKASTGSGKTLAFGIPIIEKWLELSDSTEDGTNAGTVEDPVEHPVEDHVNDEPFILSTISRPIALILSPTRELAHQLARHLLELCAGLCTRTPRICCVTGGLSIYKQQRQLASADIIVATPGRLWEVIQSGDALLAALKAVRFLVIDEADRLLSPGHFQEAEDILAALGSPDDDLGGNLESPKPTFGEKAKGIDSSSRITSPHRQTLVFSATFHRGLQQRLAGAGRGPGQTMNEAESIAFLASRLKFREATPRLIDVNPVSRLADGLHEGIIECAALEKDVFLYMSLLLAPPRRTLIFTNSISAVRRLLPLLQLLDIPALALHSQMPQKARLRSIERFSGSPTGKKSSSSASGGPIDRPVLSAVLVATDVAARGLDIPCVDAIVHYHVPRTADAYVHRCGRTARGDRGGVSLLLCAPEEVTPTRRLAAKVHDIDAARRKGGGGAAGLYMIHTVDVDRRLVTRLRPRVELAKRIADTGLAKEKARREDGWVRAAADELGVEPVSDSEAGLGLGWGGRGSGRRQRETESRNATKADVAVLRAQLRELLSRRVNAGVKERYIAAGGVDVREIMETDGHFLGKVESLL